MIVPEDGYRELRVPCWVFSAVFLFGCWRMWDPRHEPRIDVLFAVMAAIFFVWGCFARHFSEWMSK